MTTMQAVHVVVESRTDKSAQSLSTAKRRCYEMHHDFDVMKTAVTADH